MKCLKLKESFVNEFLRLIEWTLKQIFKVRQFIIEKFVKAEEHKFLDLTPEDNGKGFESYFKALNWALKNEKINNLALTGPYGSGKTSILKSFEKLHSNYKFLWISLASFNDKAFTIAETKKDNEGGVKVEPIIPKNQKEELKSESKESLNEKEILEQKIELSIFQQLFYQERSTKLPLSRFKRINNTQKWILIIQSVTPILFLLSIVDIFEINFIKKMNIWQSLYDIFIWPIEYLTPWEIYHKSIFNSTSIVVFIGSIIWLIYNINRIVKNSTINKFKIQNAEIEINPKVSVSILNKYLDEILYYFEISKKNVVVLEDLDRFGNKDIFVKLREINTLINKSRSKRKRVVFLYAIKDDMFKSNEDRTKFFDYMIPVIPVISSANSKEWLFDYLDGEFESKIQPNGLSINFIKDVSKFIEDMRLLKSICNEYFIYKERLKDKEDKLNKNNLFAMLLYKNMFPDCFVELQLNKGELFDSFKKKPLIIKSHIDNYNNSIDALKTEIDNIYSHRINDIKELRSIYINALRNHVNHLRSIEINNETIEELSILTEDDYFSILSNSSNIKCTKLELYSRHNGNIDYYQKIIDNNISFKDIENKVSDIGYMAREKMIIDRTNNKTNEFKIKIEQIKIQISQLQRSTFSNLKNDFEIDSFLPDNKLIRYLIRNGYIDENYHNYISYFYEGSLTLTDNDFLLNVISNTKTPFDYELNKIESLINEIDIRYFSTYPILNYNLIDYLLFNSKSDFLQPIFSYLLKSESKQATDFIDGFLDNGLNKGIFIKELVFYWNRIWFYIENVSDYTDDKVNLCLKLIINNLSIDDIKTLGLESYLKQKSDFLQLFSDEECENAKTVIKSLNIEFYNLDYYENRNELLNFICENNLFEININNIILFAHYVENSDEANLKNCNYTTILNTSGKFLKTYIEEKIDKYVSLVLLKLEDNKHESVDSIIKLLNNNKISNNNKGNIIEKEEFILMDLYEIGDLEMQKILLKNNKVFVKWKNVIDYFDFTNAENDIKILDETLIDFVNKQEVYTELSIDKSKEISVLSEFIDCLVAEQKISDSCFESILKSIDIQWESFLIESLSEKKIVSLIDNNKIIFNADNYNFISQAYNKQLFRYVLLNKTEFQKNYKELIISIDIVTIIIKSNEFNDDFKLNLYKYAQENYTLEINAIKDPDFWNSIGISIFIENEAIGFNLIKPILINSNRYYIKIQTLNSFFNELTEQEIIDSLGLIGGEYSKIAIGEGQQKLDIVDYNKVLIENLKSIQLITSGSGKEWKGKLRVYHRKVQ